MGKTDQKERLISLIVAAPPIELPFGSRAQGKTIKTAQTIADYLLANGVFVPPCKIGENGHWVTSSGVIPVTFDRIFMNADSKWMVRARYHCSTIVYFVLEDFGKIVFLSCDEAEKEYEERRKK